MVKVLNINPIFKSHKNQLEYSVFETRDDMGCQAAKDVADKIVELQTSQEDIRMIFAAAPSQIELLHYLNEDERIEWDKIIAFHMDEYLGLDEHAPQLFQKFLVDHIFGTQPFKQVHLINSSNDSEAECNRYSELLREKAIDIVCLGIGENGHLAFNDPPVADFRDLEIMKVVELDEICKQQQVNDGCFPIFSDVPKYALTLTIPTLFSAKNMYCVVPGKTKVEAVSRTLNGPISTECPATILREHPNAYLYVDRDSYGVRVDGE